MAICLNPLTIPSPSVHDAPHSCPSAFWRDNYRPYVYDSLVVPCGKCINCLKNKQSQMVVRIKREAEKRGSLCFLTLTYDDEHLPLAQSLWKVDNSTGELTLECPAEIISSARFPNVSRLGEFKQIVPGANPRYIDVPIPEFSFAEPGCDFFARITPSVCREDVRLFIKRVRVSYKRAFGKSIDFSYVCVPEYGPRTCRPHYHLALMGISKDTCGWLSKQWNYGFTKCDFVERSNKNQDDPWSAVAFYIGKYMSKGKFECPSVVAKECEKPRVCQSLGVGVGDFEKLKPFVCAFDMFGEYDLNTLRLKNGSRLSDIQVQKLCEEIPKRLVYRLNNNITLPLPRLIRNRIFFNFDRYEKPSKTYIWYLVTASLRNKYEDLHQREFAEFLSSNAQRALHENCIEFEKSKSFSSSLEASAREEDLQSFYAKSMF